METAHLYSRVFTHYILYNIVDAKGRQLVICN